MDMGTQRGDQEQEGHGGGMMPMMAAMMAICLGVLTLVVVLPAVGLPAALGVAVALGAAMLIGHRLFMRQRGHHH